MTAQSRCAIYTRKSTEEGLEQDFNSLHSQPRLARPSSEASGMRAGGFSPRRSTTAVIPAGPWTALPFRDFSPLSRPAK